MRLSALAWRSLAARPLRTALTILGIALGVALVAGTFLANQASAEAVDRAARDLYGHADLRVRSFDVQIGLTQRAVDTLRTLDGVEAAAVVAERRLQLSTPPGDNERVFPLLVVGVDPADEAVIREPALAAGHYLTTGATDEIVLGVAYAREMGLVLGDELLLTGSRPDAPALTIVGLLEPTGFGALANGAVGVMDRGVLSEAFDVPAPITAVDLVVAEGQIDTVQAGITREMTEPFVVETQDDAAAELGAAQAGFAGVSFLFGLVALAVGAFVVTNTLAMTVSERTREIGLLRAAGMVRRQVRNLVLRQGLYLGVIGAGLGIALGVAVGAAMIAILGATRTVLVGGLPIDLQALAVAFLVGVAVTVFAAWTPAADAAAVPTMDTLRTSGRPGRSLWSRLRWIAIIEVAVLVIGLVIYPLTRGTSPLGTIIVAVAVLVGAGLVAAFALEPLGRIVSGPFTWFFGAGGYLGRANLSRDRARTGLTVAAMTVALGAVVALGTTSESADRTADKWVNSIMPGGYAIRLPIPVPINDFTPVFAAVSGTKVASPIALFPAVLDDDGVRREVGMAAIDPTTFLDEGSLIMVEGDRGVAFEALRDGGHVLIPQSFAQREGLTVGSNVTLDLPGESAAAFEVAGIVAYSLPGRTGEASAIMSLDDAKALWGVTDASLWAMVRQPTITATAYEQMVAVAAVDNAGEPLSAEQVADRLTRSLDQLIGLYDALALVAVLIGALGIVNTLSLAVSERVREIAILRAHGMTVGQVQAMVVAEASIMGLVGGLLAAVAGVVMAWAIVATSARADFAAGLVIPWPLLAVVVLVGLGISALAGIYPARRAAKLSMVAGLKGYE